MRQPVRREERDRREAAEKSRKRGSRNGGSRNAGIVARLPRVLERKVRPSDVKAVGEVRGELRQLLSRWAEPGSDDLAEIAALLTSELVTNALVHAKGGAVVRATVTDRLRVEVRDFASRRPEPRAPTADGTSGRGLMLVCSLADAWGVRSHAVGKSVWFELGIGENVRFELGGGPA